MTGPKERKERALGMALQLKAYRSLSPKSALSRRGTRPGMQGTKRQRRSGSDFLKQIKEKQKFKLSYGIDERTLRRIFTEAKRSGGNVGDKLWELLESRLDNAVFRSGLAPSRGVARQLVRHGHIILNGKRVKSPGCLVAVKDIIGIYEYSKERAPFHEIGERLGVGDVSSWLTVNKDTKTATVIATPREEQPQFEVNLLVESFSK